MKSYICPYSVKSKSAKELSILSGIPLIKNTKLKYLKDSKVVFWGTPQTVPFYNQHEIITINNDENRLALNKKLFHDTIGHLGYSPSLYDFYSSVLLQKINKEALLKILTKLPTTKKHSFIGYKYLTSHGGKGVSFYREEELISLLQNNALEDKLLSKYIPRKAELRIHFNSYFDSIPPLIQQKKIATNALKNDITFKIRSHSNGWFFSPKVDEAHINFLNNINYKEILSTVLSTLKLQFGAFDVLISSNNKFYILELNTAPGINCSETRAYYTNLLSFLCNQKPYKSYVYFDEALPITTPSSPLLSGMISNWSVTTTHPPQSDDNLEPF